MQRQPAKRFEDLVVWQRAHQLVLGVYRYSASFPKSELYRQLVEVARLLEALARSIETAISKGD
jgi:hypothetical protein